MGKFLIALEWKMLACFMTIRNILRPFGIICAHLVYFFPFWYAWTKKSLATLGPRATFFDPFDELGEKF
jgi:uncharacterized RDD family membrane protein YckC